MASAALSPSKYSGKKVIEPLLENALSDEIPPKKKPQPKSNLEKQYVAVQQHMSDLFKTLGIAA
jgi:hypothetical protein